MPIINRETKSAIHPKHRTPSQGALFAHSNVQAAKNLPIDFVITWVDGSDPKWKALRDRFACQQSNYHTVDFQNWSNATSRYRDWDNLRYWFRAVEKYAPWVHKIHFVTYGHLPEWLNTTHPKLHIVKHSDFIPAKYLPTFNSNTIELNLHRIKGLSTHFVYFNDDMFLNAPARPTDFFKNSLPCEAAGLDIIRTDPHISSSDLNNTKLLNRYFTKKSALHHHRRKWYHPKNGRYLIKTILLTPWKNLSGIAESHVASSYLKSSFRWLWQNEPVTCDTTCSHRFRDPSDINHWAIKGYQLLTGQFQPRRPKLGQSYDQNTISAAAKDILIHTHPFICINDSAATDADFTNQKQAINTAFQQVLPKKSSFEKD